MNNPIEEKRRLVQERIAKSFDSGINVSEEMSLEKAHQDGEMHPNGKWVWVSSANGGKGDWRTANGRAHKKHQETNGKKEGDGEKKTIDDHASGASTDALKRAASDKDAKPEVREAAKKELEKRNDGTEQKNDKASSSTTVDSKVDISKIPNAEFKRITQMLEKKNPDHRDAERYLEEEAMSDSELKNFHAVAEHFKNSSNINKLTQEYCRKWAELAKQEMQSRHSNSDTDSEQVNAEQNKKPSQQGVQMPKHHFRAFADTITNKEASKLLKEFGVKGVSASEISNVDISDDGSKLQIHYRNGYYGKGSKDIDVSGSQMLQDKFDDFKSELDKVLKTNEVGKLDKDKLNAYIGIELGDAIDKTHNDSKEWREGAYDVYKKYSKNNPMSVDKFNRLYAADFQDASQGEKMNYFFNAMERGASAEEAEEYTQREFKALKKHLEDPVMRQTEFRPAPFSKGNETEYVSVRSLIDSINKCRV